MTLPPSGTWCRIVFIDGQEMTCRFVRAVIERTKRENRLFVDHGAYGSSLDDTYLLRNAIASISAVPRPRLLLTYRDPTGAVRRVGRYATQREAEFAIASMPEFIYDVRIEEQPQ